MQNKQLQMFDRYMLPHTMTETWRPLHSHEHERVCKSGTAPS
jgi:hypothetical protein